MHPQLMHIGILGSRGIPNRYGGFEQLAEKLAGFLVQQGNRVSVYSPHHHPYTENSWEGVGIIHKHDPETYLGAAGHFLYDLACIMDSRRRGFDIILQLGYTTSAVWFPLHPAKARVITNMDGMEWQRSKYKGLLKGFLRWSEKRAVRNSHALVTDSRAIAAYYNEKYGVKPSYIAYGAEVPEKAGSKVILEKLEILPREYNLLIARMQEDNHIREIISGHLEAATALPLVVVGNTGNAFGKYLKRFYHGRTIIYTGPIFDREKLDALRQHCNIYFHGHSAGGTNPSLLEAMAAGAFICAHDNPFNREVLGENALYFRDENDIINLLATGPEPELRDKWIHDNQERISRVYRWEDVSKAYLELMEKLLEDYS